MGMDRNGCECRTAFSPLDIIMIGINFFIGVLLILLIVTTIWNWTFVIGSILMTIIRIVMIIIDALMVTIIFNRFVSMLVTGWFIFSRLGTIKLIWIA
jgi:hypothetical protein